ncbi:MAG: L,D-transpeptidase [Synergistaceae bacterium]|nr:L,D-transpeptidase [Synergistaceae bacterium]
MKAALFVLTVLLVAFGIFTQVFKKSERQGSPDESIPKESPAAPASDDISSLQPDRTLTPPAQISPKGPSEGRGRRGTLVVINKSSYSLVLYKDGAMLKKYRIAVGRNSGNKMRVGDMRTPEGEFPIVQIQNASSWTHDFGDGKGQIKGAYGPYFIRLGTPGWTGIGIHGTHAPTSIGTKVTEGCIRLNNRDLLELRSMVSIGDRVIIEN